MSDAETPKKDYKSTLFLPVTDFPMKAGLAQREPAQLEAWTQEGIYRRILEKRATATPFLLHDGPPYANGNIHIGHALNKVLKDIIVKHKTMQGRRCEYIPGWDCHGLPIEWQVEKELGSKARETTKSQKRKLCRDYAAKFVGIQKADFARLGIFGEWDNPYLTMAPTYQASILEAFAEMVERGLVYRKKRPVYWDWAAQTALAEAEVEYEEKESPSIYVKFPLPGGLLGIYDLQKSKSSEQTAEDLGSWDLERIKEAGSEVFLVIWTTTPWTLPGNIAVSINPLFTYSICKAGSELWIVAQDLRTSVSEATGVGLVEVGRMPGRWLVEVDEPAKVARHPWIDRPSVIIRGEHVTLDAGTGLVHTAPGHGLEDYIVCQFEGWRFRDAYIDPHPETASARLNRVFDTHNVYCPVDEDGRFTNDVPEFAGQRVFEANEGVIALLREKGMLVAEKKIKHSYPHSWRTKKPIIFRATDQWWLGIDDLLESRATLQERASFRLAVEENKSGRQQRLHGTTWHRFEQDRLRSKALGIIAKDVKWIPAYGQERIAGMMRTRPDWCLSRQRAWGVPIPAVCCEGCGQTNLLKADTIRALAKKVATDTVDVWFDHSMSELGINCPACASPNVKAEEDILDVWFDSGVSHYAVCDRRLKQPVADMYLEGSDQHRGWFNSSLTTAVAMGRGAPYKTVLTHGFVLDGQGRAMSKSVGNVIAPQDIIKQSGADVLRLWISSEDYRDDVRISTEIMNRMSEAYRRIRNTARFMLGGLADFDPARHLVPVERLGGLDRYMLHQLAGLIADVSDAMEQYEFHRVHQRVNNFCVVDLSAFYLDIIKDRLYCDAANDPTRRAAQTVMHHTLSALTRMVAPILPFTAEEIWKHSRHEAGQPDSVHLADWPNARPDWKDDALAAQWEKFREIGVGTWLDSMRSLKVIGSSLDACIIFDTAPAFLSLFADIQNEVDRRWLASNGQSLEDYIAELFIVSRVEFRRLDEKVWPPVSWHALRSITSFGTIEVAVNKAPGEKCARCWQYKELQGDLCGRCTAVVKS